LPSIASDPQYFVQSFAGPTNARRLTIGLDPLIFAAMVGRQTKVNRSAPTANFLEAELRHTVPPSQFLMSPNRNTASI
jgi:hypothetical protein